VIERYLGNKNELIEPILEEIEEKIGASGTVGDLMAGSLSVSMALKREGYSVVMNDINEFSLLLGRAFIEPDKLPDLSAVLSEIGEESGGGTEDLRKVLDHLQNTDEGPGPGHSFYRECYAPGGSRARGTNRRGKEFERRYFTEENASRIDRVLWCIRRWYQGGILSDHGADVLLAFTMRAVEKRANTQGTFHECILTGWDDRAKMPFQFELPSEELLQTLRKGGSHSIGNGVPSEEYAAEAPHMDLLYLDPPYNSRQYSDYYFMLNQIARHHKIEDLERFFDDIEYQRGQNMNTSVKSDLSRKGRFLDTLGLIIENADCDWVLLSYNNGANHWGSFKEGTSEQALTAIRDWMTEQDYLDAGTVGVRRELRTNYQSRGEKGMGTTEYLISVRKS